MISFSKLGEYGRFGNQLFQYAFLRTQAKRLGVKFYCPKWTGDKIFNLNDQDEKGDVFIPKLSYVENAYKHGFNSEALEVKDQTDIAGYFQSEKFFNKEDVLTWFSFKGEVFEDVINKYKDVDFSNATALHVRLGDYVKPSLMFYMPKPEYFKEAISILKPNGKIIVFSDNALQAKEYLGEMPDQTIYLDGNKDYEDFYLMTLCKDIVCSPSSFSWWASYLNRNKDKRIIMPSYWFVPGCRVKNNDIFLNEHIRIDGHRLLLDNYYIRYVLIKTKTYNFFNKL